MIGVIAIFWASLLAVGYAYAGYLAVLWLLAQFQPRSRSGATDKDPRLPHVTMVISAFNEEAVIGRRIENALSLDYPRELLEIVVASDGSNDRTSEIAMEFASKGVVLRHYEGRIGKTACLNRVVPMATGSIIVFSDANSTYDKGAVKALVRPFQDVTVGFVTGWTRYGAGEGKSASGALGIYSRLELLTKELESQLGSCIGADGAIFAIRKELFLPLKDYDINDLVIPLSINKQGYRGVLQRAAFCHEKDAGSTKGEFQRQVRITNRTLRAISSYRQLLNPFAFGLLSFELFSHKVCKLVVPFFLATLLLSNLLLATHGGFYQAVLLSQALLYIAAGTAQWAGNTGLLTRVADTARTFVVVNAAVALAWVKYFQGETYTTWSPTRR